MIVKSISSLVYKIESLAPIIAWLFKCLKEWIGATPEQYVLMGVVFPLWLLLCKFHKWLTTWELASLILNSILIFSSLLILISLCQNCIFPKMFSKVFLFWFNRLSFQCLGWNWGGALWKVNAFEWWSFLWTKIQYCSILKFLRASFCYFISRFPSIFFFKTFQNDIKQPSSCYEIEKALSSVGRLMVRELSSRKNQGYCSYKIY